MSLPLCIVCRQAPAQTHGVDFLTGEPCPAWPPVCEECWPAYERAHYPEDIEDEPPC